MDRLLAVTGTRAGWLALNRVSQSFLAKGVTLLAVTSFVLANFPWAAAALGGADWRLRTVFVGALVFVIGHAIAALKAPPELNGRSDPIVIAAEMASVHSPDMLRTRRVMLKALLERLQRHPPGDLLPGNLVYAAQALHATRELPADAGRAAELAVDLYHADIQLRQFDRPGARLAAFLLLWLGAGLMLVPTGLNVLATLGQFAGG